MEIKLNQQNQQRFQACLQQIQSLNQQMDELTKTILDTLEIDYKDLKVELSPDLTKLIVFADKVETKTE